jgi:hypothetical protein
LCNWVSPWVTDKKSSLITNLLKHMTQYLYTKEMVQLERNEIKKEVKFKSEIDLLRKI